MDNIIGVLICPGGFFLLFLLFILLAGVRVVNEYERGVIFRLGRLAPGGPRGPGLFYVIPVIERMVKVDLRTITLDIPKQECITNDNVSVEVNAVALLRVVDPEKAVVQVRNYIAAILQIAQTSLRSVIGQVELDDLLGHRERVNNQLQQIIDEHTEPWGIKVSVVEVKDVTLPPQMQRAMARQAEAEREKRAKIIHAQGELQAAKQLQEAAATIAKEPAALQLRYLQTLTEIAVEKNSTIIFPVPIDLLAAFSEILSRQAGGAGSAFGDVNKQGQS